MNKIPEVITIETENGPVRINAVDIDSWADKIVGGSGQADPAMEPEPVAAPVAPVAAPEPVAAPVAPVAAPEPVAAPVAPVAAPEPVAVVPLVNPMVIKKGRKYLVIDASGPVVHSMIDADGYKTEGEAVAAVKAVTAAVAA